MNHKRHYRAYLTGKKSEIAVYSYFKQYGIDNFDILLIEEIEIETTTELRQKEQEYINKSIVSIKIKLIEVMNIKKNIKKNIMKQTKKQ